MGLLRMPQKERPTESYIEVRQTYKADPEAATPFACVVTVFNKAADGVFLPQVAGVFFGLDSHNRGGVLANQLITISNLTLHLECDNAS